MIWAAKGRSKDTVGAFFDALGDRAASREFVTADGAAWITDVVAERAPDAIVSLDTFHVVGWATKARHEVRRQEWNKLRTARQAQAAKEFTGLRFLLRRNWENVTMGQREVIWALETANRHTFRAFQLKKSSATSSPCPCSKPGRRSTTGSPTRRAPSSRPVREARPHHPRATGPRWKRP